MDAAIPLQDGREVRLRAATLADAHALAALQRALVAAGDGMVLGEGDLPEGPEAERERLREQLERHLGSHGAWIVAEATEGGLLGEVSLHRLGPSLLRHVAVLAIGVHPEAQGLGLGRRLMEAALAWATDGPGREAPPIQRLELYVRADNLRARRLYESLGFEVEGVRRRFVRLPDGTFIDDLVMGRLL